MPGDTKKPAQTERDTGSGLPKHDGEETFSRDKVNPVSDTHRPPHPSDSDSSEKK